jgi:hypothetical protein
MRSLVFGLIESFSMQIQVNCLLVEASNNYTYGSRDATKRSAATTSVPRYELRHGLSLRVSCELAPLRLLGIVGALTS